MPSVGVHISLPRFAFRNYVVGYSLLALATSD